MERITILFKLADKKTREGNFSQAIIAYKQILKLAKTDKKSRHLAHWGIGDIYLNTKNLKEAESHFKKALHLAPEEPIYHYLLGCTYNYLNKIPKAVYHLEKAVTYDASRDAFWAQLGWVYGYNIDTTKGIEYLKKALALNRENGQAYQDICMLYTKNYQFGAALVCIEEALCHYPEKSEFQEIKAKIEFFRNQFEKLGGKTDAGQI